MQAEFDVIEYWDTRYKEGGDSGAGSRGESAEWKAEKVNKWVTGYSTLDIGCGDGVQAALLRVPKYLGVEPSQWAIEDAKAYYPRKQFQYLAPFDRVECRDTHLSLDIIYHLVDDALFYDHMDFVFAANKRAIVYSSNFNQPGNEHVRHRKFLDDVPAHFELVHAEPGAHRFADFYVFDRVG